jgi:short-chain fatty acids transporter
MNIAVLLIMLIVSPLLLILLRPSTDKVLGIEDLKDESNQPKTVSVWEEAKGTRLPGKAMSDRLNNCRLIQLVVSIMGFWYIGRHFLTRGLDLNLNIMIFILLMTGLVVHGTPLRYVIATKRAGSNISGIVLQYPFYAGIAGIMEGTGLVQAISTWMSHAASIRTFPFIAFLTGGLVNFAIPSAGGEWAVVGPTIVETAEVLTSEMAGEQVTSYIARLSLAVAYGESLTNVLQPFFILIILPVMGAGTKIQARDVMGYLILPFICFFILYAILITWLPI